MYACVHAECKVRQLRYAHSTAKPSSSPFDTNLKPSAALLEFAPASTQPSVLGPAGMDATWSSLIDCPGDATALLQLQVLLQAPVPGPQCLPGALRACLSTIRDSMGGRSTAVDVWAGQSSTW